ncbi:DMT family transporter [Rhodoferax sp. U11-2br]|uniref:DMT family transporter n=1 Tax=Rhodoferax sp. U11-2br TaxID=2838878 RepID=UPI001BE56E8F|nr:DMT family transporter [Rhodoferax sp. U11-2br]MBT3066037.1 DMT family transporter [Rhodoferax sp. U11-2br]
MTPSTSQRTTPPLFTGTHMLFGALVAGLLMDMLLKQLGTSVAVWATVAWRWTLGALMLLPLVMVMFDRPDWQAWRPIHVMRSALNLIGTYGLVFGLQKLSFALVITIFFAEPLLTLLLATLIGRQPLHVWQLIFSILGLAGVGLATWGDGWRTGSFQPEVVLAASVALAGAFAGALMTVVTQVHGRGCSSLSLVFWTAVSAALVGWWQAGPCAWTVPAADLWLLCLVAGLGCVFSLLWVAALKRVAARVAAHIMYLTLPLGALAGWWVFDESPHTVSVVGSVSVFLAVLAVNRLAARGGTQA